MLNKTEALKGKMPLYKWVGNQVLTTLQNWLLSVDLAEFHTGYRAYRVSALEAVPFRYNSDYYDFDTDILIQMIDTGRLIKEIPIPTFYGDEISRVNGFKYGTLILLTTIRSRVMKWGIFYHPRFDYRRVDDTVYTLKLGYSSSHQLALDHLGSGTTVLDISQGPGMAGELSKKSIKTISIGENISAAAQKHSMQSIETDIKSLDLTGIPCDIDAVLVLDIIQRLQSPENFLRKLQQHFCAASPEIILTTGNVAFLPVRLSLLLGQFNYGSRGILDLRQRRLFTFYSLWRVLSHNGFDIIMETGLPAPFPLALENKRLADFLLKINCLLIKLSKSLFAYQIAVIARPRPTLEHLLANAQRAGEEKQQKPN